MKKQILLLTCIIFLMMQAIAKEYTIQITISGLTGNSTVILKDFETSTDINKGFLVNGKGILQGELVNGPRLLFLTIINGPSTYWCNFMISNETVSVDASVKDFPYKVKVSGSTVQDIFYRLNASLADDRIRREVLLERGKAIMADAAKINELKQLVREMFIIDSVEIITKKNFIDKHLQSYPAVLELFLLKSTYDKADLAALYFQLSTELKVSSYGNKIKNFLGIEKIIGKGDKAYAFTAYDTDSIAHSFPAATGKYILLDFTKDHCVPCMQSVKELQLIHANYAKQLQVISFSPDEKKGYEWPLLRDGKGSAGPVIMNYGVDAYPTFVLIDPKGMVVQKWSGYATGGIEEMLRPYLSRQREPNQQ